MDFKTIQPDYAITFGLLGVFLAVMIWILYATSRTSTSFTDYAVGGRAYGPWFIAMSYTNSWLPGAIFTAFFSLSIGGVFGFYGAVFSALGIASMYLMAKRAWKWGQYFNLTTQPDLLGMRYNSPALKRLASLIGIICIFPWVIMGIQALGLLIELASFGRWSVTTCLFAGVMLILVRQYWTVRMGMRGLIMTDMYQGWVAYGLSAAICLYLLVSNNAEGYHRLASLPADMLTTPGAAGTHYGPWYMFSLIFTGIVGSMCWPMSFQRIYTASGVRSVKKGTLLTIMLVVGFYLLLLFYGMSISHEAAVKANPQMGFFVGLFERGGLWLLGIALVVVLAASIGHVDGCVQVSGTQLANDLATWNKPRTDRQLTILAKSGMAVFIIAAAVMAYMTFNYSRLQLLAQISYQGIVQLAVPLFFGIFSRFGNKQGAIAGMLVGVIMACWLTVYYPDDIPQLGSLTSGVIGLACNLVIFIGCGIFIRPDDGEKDRVNKLFAIAEKATS